ICPERDGTQPFFCSWLGKNGAGKLACARKHSVENPRMANLQVELLEVAAGVGQVIAGWDMVLVRMRAGDKMRVTIPPELGYGASGVGGVIPPNATLIFEMELVELKETK